MQDIQLIFDGKMPLAQKFGKDCLIIYDRHFDKTKFKKWISTFPASYSVAAGESLKNISKFPKHISSIVNKTAHFSNRDLTIVVLGGGSVGDFGGFVASILKRGVKLVHIPSTWLAAIDSAHGGKTALNVDGYKNQVGTFYPAEQIYIIKELLFSQSLQRAHESYSELLKIGLLSGGKLWVKVQNLGAPSSEGIWSILGDAIQEKYRIVSEDPEEVSGYRHILNFGHTVGHAFESVHKLPHGIAVNVGLSFSLKWSLKKKYISEAQYEKIMSSPSMDWIIDTSAGDYLDNKYFLKYEKALLQDKKKTSSAQLRFIFLQEPGRPLIENVKVSEIIQELKRQGK